MKNTKEKPTCYEFIIEAIRTLRRNPSNLTPNTGAGVSLHRLFSVTVELYSVDDFKNGLEQLMREDKVIVTARLSERERVTGESSKRYGPTRTIKIDKLPSNELFSSGRWYLDDSNQSVDPEKAEKYQSMHHIKVYVRIDGLPKTVIEWERKKSRTLAEKIIASMSK